MTECCLRQIQIDIWQAGWEGRSNCYFWDFTIFHTPAQIRHNTKWCIQQVIKDVYVMILPRSGWCPAVLGLSDRWYGETRRRETERTMACFTQETPQPFQWSNIHIWALLVTQFDTISTDWPSDDKWTLTKVLWCVVTIYHKHFWLFRHWCPLCLSSSLLGRHRAICQSGLTLYLLPFGNDLSFFSNLSLWFQHAQLL